MTEQLPVLDCALFWWRVSLSGYLDAGVAAPDDIKISDKPYVRYDGGTDPATAACSVNNRQQNEPTVSVAPHDPSLMNP